MGFAQIVLLLFHPFCTDPSGLVVVSFCLIFGKSRHFPTRCVLHHLIVLLLHFGTVGFTVCQTHRLPAAGATSPGQTETPIVLVTLIEP